jgi:hypothetical protein
MTLALLTFALMSTGSQQDASYGETYVTERHLGKEGYEAFTRPESTTIQRVFEVRTDNRHRRRAVGKDLVGAGPEHAIPTKYVAEIISALEANRDKAMPLCAFHPDHVIRFRRGEESVEIVTCYSCHVINVAHNGEYLGTTNMPRTQVMDEVRTLVPLDEDQRATFDESFGQGFHRALSTVKSGTIQRVEIEGQVEPRAHWKAVGSSRKLDALSVVEIRSTILMGPLLETKPLLIYGVERPRLIGNVVIELSGEETISIVLPTSSTLPAYATWRGTTDYLPSGLAIRCLIEARVNELLAMGG